MLAVRGGRSSPAPLAATTLPPLDSAEVPLSTYRVQLHAGFTFAQAAETVPYLHALAVVRGCEVGDLLRTALTHLRITATERQRVAFYRHVQETGSAYVEDYTGPRQQGSGVATAVAGPQPKRRT